jgi:hypothetical protein
MLYLAVQTLVLLVGSSCWLTKLQANLVQVLALWLLMLSRLLGASTL